jgi:hypothetical protein
MKDKPDQTDSLIDRLSPVKPYIRPTNMIGTGVGALLGQIVAQQRHNPRTGRRRPRASTRILYGLGGAGLGYLGSSLLAQQAFKDGKKGQ